MLVDQTTVDEKKVDKTGINLVIQVILTYSWL